jgi:hypothetical protein
MPAGAMPPEPQPEQPEPILGKFNSPDELATAYQELEKKIGSQGNELGSMKQMNAMLLEQMQQAKARDATPATEAEKDDFDLESQVAELMKGVTEGDISIEEALAQSINLGGQKGSRDALTQYQQITAQQQRQAEQQRFLDEHPDFLELQRSGQLEAVKKQLPGMHDDFSAYFALQVDLARQQAEMDKIGRGDERTGKVLSSPGAKAKDIGKPQGKMSEAELKAHTLARLAALE